VPATATKAENAKMYIFISKSPKVSLAVATVELHDGRCTQE
jgi:hypothetical protein